MANLNTALIDGDVRIIPFENEHIEPLRAACELDQTVWDIYPVNMLDDGFDEQLKLFHGEDGWVRFAVFHGDDLVGTTSYIHPSIENGTVMIGGTYVAPSVRGTDFNQRMKKLMINHAFACGFWRIEFTVDTRNERSMAAVLKLGAKHEGTLRKNRKTWTGYVRDTAVFGLLKEEWLG